MSEFPFTEEKISEEVFVRVFADNVESGELVWHRDREDRIIESIGESNWKIQLDNELPQELNRPIFIPMGIYHRLIKGDGELKLKVIKKYQESKTTK
jgi:hypothetical protein